MKKICEGNNGYSFVELVVSILIFAMGFLGVTKLQQHAVMGNSFGMQMTNALNIIDSQSEYLRGLSFPNAAFDVAAVHNGGTQTRQGIPYTLSWKANTTSLGGSANSRTIDITVTWDEKSTHHSITMNLFKSS